MDAQGNSVFSDDKGGDTREVHHGGGIDRSRDSDHRGRLTKKTTSRGQAKAGGIGGDTETRVR